MIFAHTQDSHSALGGAHCADRLAAPTMSRIIAAKREGSTSVSSAEPVEPEFPPLVAELQAALAAQQIEASAEQVELLDRLSAPSLVVERADESHAAYDDSKNSSAAMSSTATNLANCWSKANAYWMSAPAVACPA